MSELQNVNVGIVSGVEHVGLMFPYWKISAGDGPAHVSNISKTETNKDSETLLWYLISCYLEGLMLSANHMLFKSCVVQIM
jgi:hypothetical protein